MATNPISIGMVFHYLTVVSQETSIKKQRMWKCACKCGGEKIVSSSRLMSGNVKSCGCYRQEKGIAHGAKLNLRHGNARGEGSREYQVWNSMKMRCLNSKHVQYAYYGGRGITICERWMKFDNFLEDMGPRPEGLRYSLDRIDNEKGYCKENCRWATSKEQNNNTRFNRLIQLPSGEERPLQYILPETGITRQTFYSNLRKGWTELQACGLEPRKT